jgi:hypothetical protein
LKKAAALHEEVEQRFMYTLRLLLVEPVADGGELETG